MIFRSPQTRSDIAGQRLADSRVALAHAERDLMEAQSAVQAYRAEVHQMEVAASRAARRL